MAAQARERCNVTPRWLEALRSVRVADIAVAVGGRVAPPRGASGGGIFGCPACYAQRRHAKSGDRRGAVGITRDGHGWRCFQCDAAGDALDFVAYALRERRFAHLDEPGRSEVRVWCLRWLGIGDSSASATRILRTQRGDPVTPPAYPDRVEAFWSACRRADEVKPVSAWLGSKNIPAMAVADANEARALVPDIALPAWARIGSQSWTETGYSLLVPLFDACGVMRSVIARNVHGRSPKSVAPAGCARAGLVLACRLARQLLARSAKPEWWPSIAPLRIEVAEGEKKFLMRASRFSDATELAPAVIGVESGSWSDALAARLPRGCELYIATDPDQQGAIYASQIMRSLRARVASQEIRIELRDEFELQGGETVRLKEVAA